MTDREIDTMNTSSIELICCALGGMLMLMLFVATLVRAKVERKTADAGDEQRAGLDATDEGYFTAPPDPLLVVVEWKGPAKYPPQLIAFPPIMANGRASAMPEAALKDENGLTESRGTVRTRDGDSFVGFFDRKPRDGRTELKLVVPGGSRSAVADAWRRKELIQQAVALGGRPSAGDLGKGHVDLWQFRVRHPDAADDVLAEKLTAAYAAADKLELRLWEQQVQWNGMPPRPLPPVVSPTLVPKGVLLRDCKVGLNSAAAVREVLAAGQPTDPAVLAVASDPGGDPPEFKVTCVAGFGRTAPDPAARREPLLAELWLTTVLPSLVDAAHDPRPAAAERHARAIKLAAAIDGRLKAANDKLKPGPGVDPLTWADLTDGPPEQAVPGTRGVLIAVRDFAGKYAGTDPLRGRDDAIPFGLKVKVQGRREVVWAGPTGATEVLKPGAAVIFRSRIR
ncbi:MAG: hypothetical protein K2X82_11805 [Gemmataceae bacterium]|nr:hypothetical protein [Gemmataceae bacterium]